MTEKDIYELIKLDKTPYWSLFVTSGYQRRHVGSFNLEGFTSLPDEDKIQKSIDALEQRLHLLSNEKNFIIKLKKTQKSNQDGVFEYQFVSTITSNSNADGGLSGVPQAAMLSGYMPLTIYDKEKELLQGSLSQQMEALKRENELNIKSLLNEYEVKRKVDQLTAKQKEVNELAKKYNSKKDMLSDTLGTLIDKTLEKWFGDDIAGLDEEDNEPDERLAKIEDFANKLYDSKLTETQIDKLINNVENIFKEKQVTEHSTESEEKQGGVPEND